MTTPPDPPARAFGPHGQYLAAVFVPDWEPGDAIPDPVHLPGVRVLRDTGEVVVSPGQWEVRTWERYPKLRNLRTGKTYTVHRIVASTLLPPHDRYRPVVRHLDDVKSHSTVDNLAWGSNRENEDDFRRNRRGSFPDHIHGPEVPLQDCVVAWESFRRKRARSNKALFGKEHSKWMDPVPGLMEALSVCHGRFIAGGTLDTSSPVLGMLHLGPNWTMVSWDANGCLLRGRWPGAKLGKSSPDGPGALTRSWSLLPAEALPLLASLVSDPSGGPHD